MSRPFYQDLQFQGDDVGSAVGNVFLQSITRPTHWVQGLLTPGGPNETDDNKGNPSKGNSTDPVANNPLIQFVFSGKEGPWSPATPGFVLRLIVAGAVTVTIPVLVYQWTNSPYAWLLLLGSWLPGGLLAQTIF